MRILIRIALPFIILAAGWFGYTRLSIKPAVPTHPRPKPRVLQTEILELNKQPFTTFVRTQGVVRPYRQAMLTAQVAGKVKELSEDLEDGGFFSKGVELVRIDGEDFEAEAFAAEATLARAEARYAEEATKSKQARLNWQDLGYKDEPNELVLRLPQLRQAEADVKAATAALEMAIRKIDRTSIKAPFDGRVLTREITVGQSITPSTPIATIFRTDLVEVRLPIAAQDLQHLELPESNAQPTVSVLLQSAMDRTSSNQWHGIIHGTEGALDEDSRELFAIARVADPFALDPANPKQTPLRIGQPVLAEIQGKTLDDVFVIPRNAVRNLNSIALVNQDSMTIEHREITPLWSDTERFIIRDDTIPHGAWLAISRLAYAPDDARVEILNTSTNTAPVVSEETP